MDTAGWTLRMYVEDCGNPGRAFQSYQFDCAVIDVSLSKPRAPHTECIAK